MSETSKHRKSFLRAGVEGAEGDAFELNLAPVIDCLTVLIVYTMISASFLSLGAFSTTVPSEGKSVAGLVPIQVRLDMNPDHSIEVTISGSEKRTDKIQAKAADWDFEAVIQSLNGLKSKHSGFNTVTLAADPQIQYADVVRGIERTKQSVPNVVLGE